MDLLGSLSQDAQPKYAKCSRKGCQQVAEFQLLWNNPKVHAPERRKIWLACSEHVGWLENYLREREFWKQTLPFDDSGANTSE
ncbi:acetone carboxylase [Rothia mucilaginosa]|uniref:Acetone carboxylase n=1 Tax=Rothia mucilaginosa TaxID=43675 RepID=A0A943YC05_9MICC|nr:acetone carboxylase [Rothia mucilaginosa]MBS6634691.1 acetone carboxylase [Rothia mucilaginosa]